jgi:hypothetical protein
MMNKMNKTNEKDEKDEWWKEWWWMLSFWEEIKKKIFDDCALMKFIKSFFCNLEFRINIIRNKEHEIFLNHRFEMIKWLLLENSYLRIFNDLIDVNDNSDDFASSFSNDLHRFRLETQEDISICMHQKTESSQTTKNCIRQNIKISDFDCRWKTIRNCFMMIEEFRRRTFDCSQISMSNC